MQDKDDNADLIPQQNTLQCVGAWTHQGIRALQTRLSSLNLSATGTLTLEGKGVSDLDSAGAWLLHKIKTSLEEAADRRVELAGFSEEQVALITLIDSQPSPILPPPPPAFHLLPFMGRYTWAGWIQAQAFLSFLGETFLFGAQWVRHPFRIRWISLLNCIRITGYDAIPIVGLLSFLIGVVLAYQMGTQLSQYGANIFVVDLLGISILREFGPLLTAIIVAGRTGSAYTAQLGTMKLNEEIDALQTMGLSPIELLVLPKFLALLIALPLLSVLSDVFGVFGGMVMSKGMLSIGYQDFLQRFAVAVETKHYLIGLIKTPVFALLIASVGCFQGFQVTNSAESIGTRTTTSVVQSIFLIIAADAGFSILFNMLGI